ncbi:Multiple sugar-binding protein precursor [compost metagenome]
MLFDGTWSIQAIQGLNPDFKFDIFPFPANEAADTKVTIQIDTGLGFPANSSELAEAKQFVKFWATPEITQQYVDETQYLPAIKGVENRTEKLNNLYQLVEAGKVYPVLARLFPEASNAQEFGNAWQSFYMLGDVDVLLDTLESIFFNANNR